MAIMTYIHSFFPLYIFIDIVYIYFDVKNWIIWKKNRHGIFWIRWWYDREAVPAATCHTMHWVILVWLFFLFGTACCQCEVHLSEHSTQNKKNVELQCDYCIVNQMIEIRFLDDAQFSPGEGRFHCSIIIYSQLMGFAHLFIFVRRKTRILEMW